MSDADAALEKAGYCRLARGETGQVAIHQDARQEYEGIEGKALHRLKRVMDRWSDGHPMTPEMFNGNEGRTQKGKMLRAFKTFKIRLYGFICQFGGVQTFFIIDIDAAKKQNKADPGILKRAKDRVDNLSKDL